METKSYVTSEECRIGYGYDTSLAGTVDAYYTRVPDIVNTSSALNYICPWFSIVSAQMNRLVSVSTVNVMFHSSLVGR